MWYLVSKPSTVPTVPPLPSVPGTPSTPRIPSTPNTFDTPSTLRTLSTPIPQVSPVPQYASGHLTLPVHGGYRVRGGDTTFTPCRINTTF